LPPDRARDGLSVVNCPAQQIGAAADAIVASAGAPSRYDSFGADSGPS
jgi:hypothetical protein